MCVPPFLKSYLPPYDCNKYHYDDGIAWHWQSSMSRIAPIRAAAAAAVPVLEAGAIVRSGEQRLQVREVSLIVLCECTLRKELGEYFSASQGARLASAFAQKASTAWPLHTTLRLLNLFIKC